jgi:hypothetical protein
VRANAPVLLWLGTIAAAGVIGFEVGRGHDRPETIVVHDSAATVNATTGQSSSSASSHPSSSPAARATAASETAPTETDWQALHELPDTADRDRQFAERVEHLAHTDPSRALALASAEKNWRLRDVLRDAAVKGWASVAPAAAADWVLALKPADRRSAVAALFDGASQQPNKALDVASRLIAASPASSSEYGHLAIDALGRAGAFQTATELATRLAGNDPTLLTTAYQQWGERNPDAALSAFQTLTDPTARRSALQGMVDGWAAVDPEQLAQRSVQLPSDDRSVALSAALSHWAERDPVAATTWIEAHDPGESADDGIVAVSQQSSLAESSPETALQWTALIVDPHKRITAQQSVLARWSAWAPDAARQYAESLLNPDDRAAALAVLPPPRS